MADCIFCEIVAGSAPAFEVYSDEQSVGFLDINPAVPGHVLIVPREHAADLWSISEEAAAAVMSASVRVAKLIRTALKPDGVNFMHATGRAAFQSVFHFHVHVLPRRYGDSIRPPFPLEERRADMDDLARMAERIRAAG